MSFSKYGKASEKVAEYFEKAISGTGELTAAGVEKDPCFYYKLPALMLLSGRLKLANSVLNYIQSNFIQDGDVRASSTVKTMSPALAEHAPYINIWILMAAQRLGRFDVVRALQDHVIKCYHPGLGGLTTHGPYEGGDGVVDILCVSHGGLASLYLGDKEKAKSAGNLINKFISTQPDLNEGIYLRMDNGGKLITSYPEEMAGLHVVRKAEANQLYFFVGYPVAFLAKLFLATGDSSYLNTAKAILDFCLTCHESIYSFNFAHKVAWGAALVARISGERKYREMSVKIADYLVTLQNEQGLFLADSVPMDKYDQSAELGCWLREIHAELENIQS